MGYWFRDQHELLPVGARGGFGPPDPTNRPLSVFRGERTAHIVKPVRVYEAMYPNAARPELFSRTPRGGWTVWGTRHEQRAGGELLTSSSGGGGAPPTGS
jgi:N6-adenosine-specific RNA methylase IME4